MKWRRGRKRPGRPPIPAETRNLIRAMSRDNRLWGAPRIHGELGKLGINISRTTVATYMIRRPYPPSPTWRTFIRNQAPDIIVAEIYSEFSDSVRAVSNRIFHVLRRWLWWCVCGVSHQCGTWHKIHCTKRSDLVSVPVTWALGSADPVKVSGRSPPDSQQSSTDHLAAVHADVPTEIGMVDVRPISSVLVGAAVPPPMSHAAHADNKEQSVEWTQQAAA